MYDLSVLKCTYPPSRLLERIICKYYLSDKDWFVFLYCCNVRMDSKEFSLASHHSGENIHFNRESSARETTEKFCVARCSYNDVSLTKVLSAQVHRLS